MKTGKELRATLRALDDADEAGEDTAELERKIGGIVAEEHRARRAKPSEDLLEEKIASGEYGGL